MKNRGYRNIIQVRTFGLGHLKKVDTRGLNIISIEAKEDLGGTLEFESERAGYNLKLGYYDGLRALRGLKGFRYYIDTDLDGDRISSYLWELDKNKIKLLKRAFGLAEGTDNRRAVFEIILSKLAKILGAGVEDDYEGLFYLLLESLAGHYGLDHF